MKRLGNNPLKAESEEAGLVVNFVGFGMLAAAGYAIYWMLAGVIG